MKSARRCISQVCPELKVAVPTWSEARTAGSLTYDPKYEKEGGALVFM